MANPYFAAVFSTTRASSGRGTTNTSVARASRSASCAARRCSRTLAIIASSEATERQLAQHQATQHAAFARTIADYFDPATGRVPARIDELLRDEGTLARTMSKFLAADGELAKVLRDTRTASREFLRAINGDDPSSALGGIKTALVTLLEPVTMALPLPAGDATRDGDAWSAGTSPAGPSAEPCAAE
jgi:hypothetical protein